MKTEEKKYLLICNTSDGLIAQLNGVIVQLQLARRLGLEPIVYLHECSFLFGGPNPYFEESQGPNVWDYYYEPIGCVSSAELSQLVKSGQVYTLSTASELARLYRWEPRSFFMNPYGYYRSVKNCSDGDYPVEWWTAQREKAREFLKDGTVQFRGAIQHQVKKFVAENFSEETLGLQLRGSDKFDFGTGPNLARKVLPEEYFPYIDQYLEEHPKCSSIFVATDQRQWLEVLREAYPDKIVSFSEWSLSDSDDNNFHKSDAKAARGVEVIVDTLLLSECSYIIKCHSAVGEMALVLNPQIDFLDLNYATQPYRARSRVLRPLLAPTIQFMCLLWRKLGENGMALEKVVSVEKDRIMVGGSSARTLNEKEGAAQRAPRPPFLSGRFISNAFRWSLQTLANICFAYQKR